MKRLRYLSFVWLVFELTVVAVASEKAYGFVPPDPSVEEAIYGGRVAFRGRIVATIEVEAQSAKTISEAHIKLLDCYYGLNGPCLDKLVLRYSSETVEEESLPVEFLVSTEVLVILFKSQPMKEGFLSFDSSQNPRIDIAYVIGDTFPKDYYASDELKLFNIFLPNSLHKVGKAKLREWANRRAAELSR